jgi:hypothetical protein
MAMVAESPEPAPQIIFLISRARRHLSLTITLLAHVSLTLKRQLWERRIAKVQQPPGASHLENLGSRTSDHVGGCDSKRQETRK